MADRPLDLGNHVEGLHGSRASQRDIAGSQLGDGENSERRNALVYDGGLADAEERRARVGHGLTVIIASERAHRQAAECPGPMLTVAGFARAIPELARRLIRGGILRSVVAQPESHRLGVGPVHAVVHRLAQRLTSTRAAFRGGPVAAADIVEAANHERVGLSRRIVRGLCDGDGAMKDPLANAPEASNAENASQLG